MALFPIRRPRFGLAFSSRSVALVERAGRGRQVGRPKVRRVQEQALTQGLLLPSDAAPNISDVPGLIDQVRALLAPLRGQTVALSLPDQAAHVALFEFDTFPRSLSEGEALLRWRFREELNLPRAETQIVYHAYPHHGLPGTPDDRARSSTLVLAVSLRRDIVAQYEQVCETVGALPVSIGLSGLELFDLCRPLMKRSPEACFAHHSPDGFTFLAVRDGAPSFLRVKGRRGGRIDIEQELLGTLQFYEDAVPPPMPSASTAEPCVWVVDTDGAPAEASNDEGEPLYARSPAEGLDLGHRRVRIKPVGWADLARGRGAAPTTPVSGLPALAGAVAA